MIDSSIFFEKFLQNYRFKIIKPYLIGSVLDFGGNKGELQKLVKGKYLAVNYNRAQMKDSNFDTIACLAVIEHIDIPEVKKIFMEFKKVLNENGRIFLTTPTKIAKPVLELLSFFNILDKKNIAEHKHYWNKKELYKLANETGFEVNKYKLFQIIFNQIVVLEHKK